MIDKLLCNVQLATYSNDESKDTGYFNLEEFLTIVDKFPWEEQVIQACELQKVAPTISAINKENDFIYFISGAGSEGNLSFVIGFIYKEESKGFLGFGSGLKEKYIDKETDSLAEAKNYLLKFFEKDYDFIKNNLR